MPGMVVPPQIPGKQIDPPAKDPTAALAKVYDRSHVAGVGFRTFLRFSTSRSSLLAAGTGYYVFLALFALIALAFGLTALIGADRFSETINEALRTAFPGLIGSGGIDPETLKTVGSTTSILGLVVLLYSGGGAMTAASTSLHLIYGTPKDPRNFVWAKVRVILWMCVIAPMILVSFAPSVIVANFAEPFLRTIGISGSAGHWLLLGASLIISYALNFFIMWLLLGRFGGVQPEPKPRLIGSAVGAVIVEVLKYLMATIVAWSVAKPQYGAFAAPIAVLFVLYLLCLALYFTASLTAAIAMKREALEPAAEPPKPAVEPVETPAPETGPPRV